MMTSSHGNLFSTLLALCEGNSPVTGEIPSQRTVTRSFDIFFDLRLNKRLRKTTETPVIWRHCAHYDVTVMFESSSWENKINFFRWKQRTRAVVTEQTHNDVMKWKHFPRYWPFLWGIQRSPGNSPHKGQWRGALMFSSICAWINVWVNNGEAGDLRRHRAHYDVTVMWSTFMYTHFVYKEVDFTKTYLKA